MAGRKYSQARIPQRNLDIMHWVYSCNCRSYPFSVADLIISKSGSVSVCEALYSNLPMILDATHNVLAWEKFNHQFITAHQFGKSITNIKDLSTTVRSLLHNHSFSTLKPNVVTFDKKQGTTGIKDVLSSML